MSVRIRFHASVRPPAELEPFPAQTLATMVREEGMSGEGELHCILVDDSGIAEMNERFRDREGPTDVLAFPYDPGDAGGVLGEVYVSVDRAREQALERDEPAAREVWRLFVHGALHLAGHDHDTDEADRRMRLCQERWVERAFPAGS